MQFFKFPRMMLSLYTGSCRCRFYHAFSIKSSVFKWNCRLSAMVLLGRVTSKLDQPQIQWKQENMKSNRFNTQNKNSECAAHFFVIIIPLTSSNLIGMAMWSCDLLISKIVVSLKAHVHPNGFARFFFVLKWFFCQMQCFDWLPLLKSVAWQY